MTTLDCASLSGCLAPLELLERASFTADELAARLPALRAACGAGQLVVLSTCQRTELYVAWPDRPEPDRLVAALAADRGIPVETVREAMTWWRDDDCVRHLLRVTSGLESFVLGETEVIGQVRAAAQLARDAGVCAGELDALFRAAVNTARKVQRETSFVAAGRSVGTAAVDAATAWWAARPLAVAHTAAHASAHDDWSDCFLCGVDTTADGGLAGRRLLMVGAGQIANAVVTRATGLGAVVTVCNRTRRHAERFAAAGAVVVDLADMADQLSRSDVVVVATAAPHRLIDAALVFRVRTAHSAPLLLVDLSVPRNVDPDVRGMPGVDLIDLADLRGSGSADAGTLASDVAVAEGVLAAELERFGHWSRAQSAGSAVRRLRAQAEDVGRQEYERVAGRLPADARALLELALHRTVHRLIHAPTQALLGAAAAGDGELVQTLAHALSPDSDPAVRR